VLNSRISDEAMRLRGRRTAAANSATITPAVLIVAGQVSLEARYKTAKEGVPSKLSNHASAVQTSRLAQESVSM
jgi:hypothetical protein